MVSGEIAFQIKRIRPVSFSGKQLFLDSRGIGCRAGGTRLLVVPVLHDHRNYGGAAAIFRLPDKRDVQPNAAACQCKNRAAETQRNGQSLRQKIAHEEKLTYRYDDQHEHYDRKNDQRKVALGQIAGGKVLLGLRGAGAEPGHFLITQR